MRCLGPCYLPATALLATIGLAACSSQGFAPKGHQISGTLTKAGGPVTVDETFGRIDLAFIPMQGDKRPEIPPEFGDEQTPEGQPRPPGLEPNEPSKEVPIIYASVSPNGSFRVEEGLPNGKYLVTVRVFPKGWPDPDNRPINQADVLKGAFSAQKSKIIREVKDNNEINIDLAKPEG